MNVDLGSILRELKARRTEPAHLVMAGSPIILSSPHSYRGYYEHVGVEWTLGHMSIEEAYQFFKGILNSTYTGYKGGYYTAGWTTEIYLARYGFTGNKINVFRWTDYCNMEIGFEVEE